MIDVERFAQGLAVIEPGEFTVAHVAHYVAEHPVDPDSLAPYLVYSRMHYTRNLIYKCALFELIAICWEIGQASAIHNHQNQNCWMAAPIGRLAVQNYDLVSVDESSGRCELRASDRVLMEPGKPAHVDPERPIHAVLNLPEFGARATSLHVYSRPYDHCLVYSFEKRSYWDVPLSYDTKYGRPSSGVQIDRG